MLALELLPLNISMTSQGAATLMQGKWNKIDLRLFIVDTSIEGVGVTTIDLTSTTLSVTTTLLQNRKFI